MNFQMFKLDLEKAKEPNPGIKPRFPALQADSLPAEPQRKPKNTGVGSLSLLQQIFLSEESNRGLLHCRRILLYQLSYQWVLNFLKGFLCIYWNNNMVFIFQFVNMVYHIDWFVNIKESLQSWNKAHLIMMCGWLEFYWGFLHLCLSVIWPVAFFFWWHICLVLVSGLWWPHRMSLGIFLPLQFSERVWVW